MSKIAILLTAPGGAGNHMWDEILVACGSPRIGDSEFGDMIVKKVPHKATLIHWFRSIPSQKHGINSLNGMIDDVIVAGFQPIGLVPTRDWFCMTESQQKRHGLLYPERAMDNARRGYEAIIRIYRERSIKYIFASYEAAVMQPEYIKKLLEYCHIKPPATLPEIRDENAKWYNH